ncbi:plasmid mobilization protein [Pseudomonas aeruginosa]|uniref:plasmid mobilization protein n=1 Tax=Pseudomonas aeruginosa TaxID=287 RepID=UPI000AC0BD5B|nr:hypothetical protein [Pseudomonas aeruginosa]
MNDNRKRNINLNVKLTAEEKKALLSAVKKSGSKNITDYIVNVAKNVNCIVISEVNDYESIYSKIGNLSNQIAKALNAVIKDSSKNKVLINYLERDNKAVLKAISNYTEKLEEIQSSYVDFENQIEIKKKVLIREYKKNNKKKGDV